MSTDLAQQVSEVPRKYETGHKSTACLLKDAGFPGIRKELCVAQVEVALTEDPDLAAMWFKRGHDQRIAGGWGIECDGDTYRIQSFANGETVVVSNPIRACAEFVVRYVKFIGDVQARSEH